MDLIRSGSAILLREAPSTKPHLWFVLTYPEGNPPRVVAVMLRTTRRHTDDTLILDIGDHPFVKHESSVHYSSAQQFKVRAVLREMARGRCHLRENISSNLLARVRQGLLDSPYTVHAIRDYCAERF